MTNQVRGTRWLVALGPLVLASACGELSGGEERPDFVLLLSLDTLAAAHTSLHGYEKPTTPFLEELAERGAVFDRHVVNSNNTLQSHASMFTGLLPPTHGAVDAGREGRSGLAQRYETLAERFREAGWSTATFATNQEWISAKFGLDQGFDHFESEWRGAPANTARFLRWLDETRPERAFVFLHYFDAHSESSKPGLPPYAARPEFLERFAGEQPAGYRERLAGERYGRVFGSEVLRHLHAERRRLEPDDLAYLRGTYDAGIAQLDEDVRRLFGELDARGVLDRALTVVTSDHGEEFGQHGGYLHARYYDEVARVPLLVVLPHGRVPARRRVGEFTSSVDLLPTLLELAGLEPAGFAQGRSFAPTLLEGAPVDVRPTLFNDSVLRARDARGEYKLVLAIAGGDEPRIREFYDLELDPDERVNLARREDPERLAAARQLVIRLRQRSRDLREAIAGSEPVPVETDDAGLAELEALGYLGD